MSAYEISGESVETFRLIIYKFLKRKDFQELDLTGAGLSPYKLSVILSNMNYYKVDVEFKFSSDELIITLQHYDGDYLQIQANVMLFTLKLNKIKEEILYGKINRN